MPVVFQKLDRLKPIFDVVDRISMLICKLLLIADVLITTMAVMGRYISFIPDPAWSEEVVLTLMVYMTVLSAALCIRRGSHIRMTALDHYLPKNVVKILDLLADVAVIFFAIVMLEQGWKFASGLGSKGYYTSMPTLSLFWMYFPVPLAGIFMLLFEVESTYRHIRAFFVKEEGAK